jgi:hypothetical protein
MTALVSSLIVYILQLYLTKESPGQKFVVSHAAPMPMRRFKL